MVEGTLKTINSYKAKKSIIKLEDLISSAIQYQYPRLKEEKVEVYTKFETRDINIKGNQEALLSNVFENLFDNTFKALVEIENKKISISTKLNNDFVEIYFSDNGVGIPEEKVPFIFSLWSSKEGSGIGLATARDTIKDHNGEIVYVDLGATNIETTFLIKLPVNK